MHGLTHINHIAEVESNHGSYIRLGERRDDRGDVIQTPQVGLVRAKPVHESSYTQHTLHAAYCVYVGM